MQGFRLDNQPSEKRVDEGWKEQMERERATLERRSRLAPPQGPQGPHPPPGTPGVDLRLFLSSLSMQALVALGELPNPGTNQPDEDLDQARYVIDVLGVLQEKTKGNLTKDEESFLESLLYELRMKYVTKVKR